MQTHTDKGGVKVIGPGRQVTADSGPALAPFSRQGLLRLISRLDREIDRRPHLADHPLTGVIIRLILTARTGLDAGGEVTGDTEEYAEDLRLELAHRTAERDELTKRLADTRGALSRVNAQHAEVVKSLEDEQAQLETQLYEMQEALAKKEQDPDAFATLQVELESSLNKLVAVGAVLADPNTKVDPKSLAHKVRQTVHSLKAMTTARGAALDRSKDLEKAVGSLKDKNAKLKEKTAKGVEAITAYIREYEYGGQSTQFTLKRTNKPIACCLVCKGLDPRVVAKGTKEAGHRKRCWFRDMQKGLTGR